MKVERAREYVIENLQYALNPRSIAVVGASRYPTKVGYKVIEELRRWGYKGELYPVNPRSNVVQGLPAYPTVKDIPYDVDLVFVAVPAHIVKSVLEDCVAKKVKIVVIATSAFKEIGRGELQNQLTQYCRDNQLPLIGPNLDQFGPRFPDMSDIYTRALREKIRPLAAQAGIDLREGVYMMYSGPSYETPAEIRCFRTMGADAVGMSTVPEAIVARHCGMDVVGVSCITNMAAGVLDRKLDHSEVVETARRVKGDFTRLLEIILDILRG